MAELTAKINLKLIDSLTAPAKQMQAAFGRLKSNMSKPIKDSTKSAIQKQRSFRQELKLTTEAIRRQHKAMNMQKSIKMAAAGVVVGMGAAKAKAAIGGAVSSIRGEQAALGDLATLGIKDFDLLKSKAREMQNAWGVTSSSFLKATYDIKSGIAGISDEGAGAITEAAAITAAATKGNVESMTSLFSMGYNKYKNQFTDMNDGDFSNMMASSLSKSVQMFMTEASKMQDALNSIGTSSMAMHEQLAVVGMLQSKGLQGGESGTAFRAFEANAMAAQQRLAKKGKKVDFINTDGTLKSVQEIMLELENLYGKQGFSKAEVKQELKEAFGTEEAVKLLGALWGENEELVKNIQEVAKGGQSHLDMAKAKLDTDAFTSINQYKNSMLTLKQTMGDALLPAISSLAVAITPLIQNFTTFLENNQGLAAAIGAVTIGLTGIAGVAAPILIAMPAMSHALLGVKMAMAAVRIASLSAAKALLANPIILIAAGLAAAAYLIYKNWDKLKPFFQNLMAGIKASISKAWSFIKTIFKWSPIGIIISNWGHIKNAICNPLQTAKAALSAVWNGIKALFNWVPKPSWGNIKHAICNPIETAKAALSAVWEGIKALFLWRPDISWDDIKTAMLAPVEAAKESMKKAMDSIKNLFRKAPSLDEWEQQHAKAQGSINGHLSAIKQLTGSRIDALNAIENMTEAEKEQARQHAELAKSEAELAKINTMKTMRKQMKHGLFNKNYNEGLLDLEAIEKGEMKAIELYKKLLDLKGNLKGTGLNKTEYDNLLEQAKQLAETEKQIEISNNAINNIEGKPPPPPPERPNPALEMEVKERPKNLEQTPKEPVNQVIKPINETQVQSLKNLKKLASEVETAVKDAENYLLKIDWSKHGIRIMQTLAQGMRTGGVAVRAAVQDTMAGLPNASGGGSNTGKGLYDGE